jgi:hypothetical protein
MFESMPSRTVDHPTPRISIRNTSAAADLTALSEVMTRSTVGVFSIVRWKRNHEANGMDRIGAAGSPVKSITTRPKPPP